MACYDLRILVYTIRYKVQEGTILSFMEIYYMLYDTTLHMMDGRRAARSTAPRAAQRRSDLQAQDDRPGCASETHIICFVISRSICVHLLASFCPLLLHLSPRRRYDFTMPMFPSHGHKLTGFLD